MEIDTMKPSKDDLTSATPPKGTLSSPVKPSEAQAGKEKKKKVKKKKHVLTGTEIVESSSGSVFNPEDKEDEEEETKKRRVTHKRERKKKPHGHIAGFNNGMLYVNLPERSKDEKGKDEKGKEKEKKDKISCPKCKRELRDEEKLYK